jgi:hypothetical protein
LHPQNAKKSENITAICECGRRHLKGGAMLLLAQFWLTLVAFRSDEDQNQRKEKGSKEAGSF